MSECEHVVIQKTYQYDRQKNITGEYWICVGCKLRFVPMGLAEAENAALKRENERLKTELRGERERLLLEMYNNGAISQVQFDHAIKELAILAVEEITMNKQIDLLANFIMANVEGEPSRSEGAVECAIRIILNLQRENKQMKRYFGASPTWDGYMDSVETALLTEQVT